MGVSPLSVTLVVSHLQELTLGPEVAENMHYKRNRRNTCHTDHGQLPSTLYSHLLRVGG